MELMTIGVVVNTHGLKGTVKVKSFTDFKEERYKKGTILYMIDVHEFSIQLKLLKKQA